MGPNECFNQIIDNFLRSSTNIRKVKPDYDLMLLTRWENSDVENWEKAKNQSIYWEAASTYALQNNVTIVLTQAFDNAGTVPSERQTGWWNLTDDSKMSEVDAYIEKMPVISLPENPPDDESPRSSAVIVVSVVAGTILCLLLVAAVVVVRHRKLQRIYSQQIQDFFKGTPIDPEYLVGTCSTYSKALRIPYDSSYELSKKMLRIETDHPLGQGNFGYVFKATITYNDREVDVALKMTRRKVPKNAMRGLLSEIKILTYLDTHANIVALKGAYTSELANGVVYLATELCRLGSLEGYLRAGEFSSRDSLAIKNDHNEGYTSTSENQRNVISLNDMMRWAYGIACGMEYIGSKQVVHADLATRNVLLTSNKTAKISDFGLSRRMYDYQKYVKKGEEPLPWRWMAIESLKKCEFSAQSDMWSYGVTLWEIFSLGDTPYPGMSWTPDFADRLVKGLRLQCPKIATESIFSIMSLCWHIDPTDRISFTSLRERMDQIMEKDNENDQYVTATYLPVNEIYLDEIGLGPY